MTEGRHGWDVVVVGIGAMGSAALFELARRDVRVLGLDRFRIPHDRGSSHGRSRIIRLAYFEDPAYVPLVRRALELWRKLERISGERLLVVTGSLDAGPAGSEIFEGSLAACIAHDLDHEALTPRELGRRFPGFRLPEDTQGVFQPEGGVLHPERCVESQTRFAESLGATVRTGVRVEGWEAGSDGIRIETAEEEGDGVDEVRCERLVLTPGPWAEAFGALSPGTAIPERQVVGWLRPFTPNLFTPERFPVFNLQVPEGHYYGFPDLRENGIKIGRFHHRHEHVDPERMERSCSDGDRRVLRDFVERYLPEGAGEMIATRACLFTNTPDGHFVLGALPDDPRVVVGAGFSGHGFKFAPVVGEILADLALDGRTRHDVGPFGVDRFAGDGGERSPEDGAREGL